MLLSRGRRWETTSEKRGVWPLLTDCGTCTRTRLTISRRAREAGVRAPACGPIKIVQVCDPDQILTLTAHPDKVVVSTKCACETTMRQHRTCRTQNSSSHAPDSSTILLRSAAAVGLLKHFQSQFSRATCGRPRQSLRRRKPSVLTPLFVHQNRCGNRDVERLEASSERDRHDLVAPPSDPILKLQTKPSPNTLDPSCACFARYSRAHRPFPLRSLRARLYA